VQVHPQAADPKSQDCQAVGAANPQRAVVSALARPADHPPRHQGISFPVWVPNTQCDNIFINGAHGEVKIGDMGTAKMKLGKKYTVIGTPVRLFRLL
jgi:hypothetical protein